MNHFRNKIGLGLLILSVILLVPGLTFDLLSITISIQVPLLGSQEVHDETRSILGTISSLVEHGNITVAFLILLFSVIVPFVKATLLGVVLIFPSARRSDAIHAFVSVISKWAMADVFVVGVFIAFLSTRSDDNIEAVLHSGFYYFTAYCIVSVLSVQLIDLKALRSTLD
jgi:paraquat-inducible protein A